MPTTDPRIDAYIKKAAPFAQPILTELRRRVHAAAPAVEETLKWNAPFFLVDGNILASMAAFKTHTKFLLWPNGMSRTSKPETTDFASVDELPTAAAFIARIAEVAKGQGGAPAAPAAKKAAKSTKAAAKPPAKKAAAKKPAAKKAPARKSVAKKSGAKKRAAR